VRHGEAGGVIPFKSAGDVSIAGFLFEEKALLLKEKTPFGHRRGVPVQRE
jgi:hypothetical protein